VFEKAVPSSQFTAGFATPLSKVLVSVSRSSP